MKRRSGIRRSQPSVPGEPSGLNFSPMNGSGPGQRDSRSRMGDDDRKVYAGGTPGFYDEGGPGMGGGDFFGGMGGPPGKTEGEPGKSYAGGTPGFYDEGGPGMGGPQMDYFPVPTNGRGGSRRPAPGPGMNKPNPGMPTPPGARPTNPGMGKIMPPGGGGGKDINPIFNRPNVAISEMPPMQDGPGSGRRPRKGGDRRAIPEAQPGMNYTGGSPGFYR